MNEELINAIQENSSAQSTQTQSSAQNVNYLVFKIGLNSFAIESSMLQEVMRNVDIFPAPFVPEYLKGIINFYGKPCAVIDFALLQDYPAQTEKLFLVLKNESDIALQVSEIQEFHNSSECVLQKISGSTDSSYFTNALNFDDDGTAVTAPVLNINGIIAKIRMDLENS